MDPFRLVDAFRQALERRDIDRLAAVLHPDVELHLYSAETVIVGREEAREWYRQAFASRILFEGEAASEDEGDGALVARGRIRWYDEGVLRDRPGEWRITFRDDLIHTVTAQQATYRQPEASTPVSPSTTTQREDRPADRAD
jgi:ketosteroid isomerase-like protein